MFTLISLSSLSQSSVFIGAPSFVHKTPLTSTMQVHSLLSSVLIFVFTERPKRNFHTELMLPVQTAGSCHSYHWGVSAVKYCLPKKKKTTRCPFVDESMAVWNTNCSPKDYGKTYTFSMDKVNTRLLMSRFLNALVLMESSITFAMCKSKLYIKKKGIYPKIMNPKTVVVLSQKH